jgi:tetratricopeptide (TPR) repeat protein
MMTSLEQPVDDRDRAGQELIERNREIAAVAYLRGDIDKAEQAVDEILGALPDDTDALNRKGRIHRLRGELEDAEAAYQRALEIAQQQADKSAEAVALGNLGIVYGTRGDLDRAEEMFNKLLEIDSKFGYLEGMASDYGNLGNVYATRGDLGKARELWTTARDLFQRLGALHMVEKVQGWIDDLPR